MAENTSGITGAILAKANEDAAKIIAAAQQYAAAKIAEAEKLADDYIAAARIETANQCAFITERSESNARIERKKALTGAKDGIVDGVFANVKNLLASMSEDELVAFFGKIIENYADSEDVAIISDRNKSVADKVRSLSAVKEKHITVETEAGLPDGMLLSGKKADKDFTFDALAGFYRENMRAEIAEQLFGQNR